MSRKRTEITSPDRNKIAALLQATSDPRDQERLIVARMAMTGQHTLAMMEEAVGRARSCIQTGLNSFEAGGVDALLRRTPPPGRPPSILSGEPVFCHRPTVSCEAVWTFLGELVQTDPGAHHVILWDGAGFHQSSPAGEEEWAALAKVHVLKLPPYCPELNPTEKIQDQLKDAVCNRVFGTIEALQEGMLPKLREFWENPLRLSSLIGNNWLCQQVNASYRVILPAFK